MNEITPAEKDGKYEFKINYSERELNCKVEKEQDKLHVSIDDNINAELKINNDGSIEQVEGTPIPASTIDYIKKQILGHQV
ncbi:hypothetical protein GCM10023149_18840 [Mucilaginibacter gynuensis]|uniref:Uncharacterized protein n=1 Tax=Mucilaginibacter gynuensis TaxID=1302236 RepID=A0ABP8G917_9SPHI